MNTKKINAFTLSEMLVVLVVSSILISMAFVVVSMVQKQVYLIQKNLSDIPDLYLLNQPKLDVSIGISYKLF